MGRLISLVKITTSIVLVFTLGCDSIANSTQDNLPEYQAPSGARDFLPIEVGDVWKFRYSFVNIEETTPFEEEGVVELHVGAASFTDGVWFHEIEDLRFGIRVALDSSRTDTLEKTFSYKIAEDADNFIYLPIPELGSALDPFPRYSKAVSQIMTYSSGPTINGCQKTITLGFEAGLGGVRISCFVGTDLESDFFIFGRQQGES